MLPPQRGPVLQSHPYPEQGLRGHRLKSGHAPALPQALTCTHTSSRMHVHTRPCAWAHAPYTTPAEQCWPLTGPLGREGACVHHHQAPARPLLRGANTLPPPALLFPQGPWLLPGSSDQRPAGRQVLAMTSARKFMSLSGSRPHLHLSCRGAIISDSQEAGLDEAGLSYSRIKVVARGGVEAEGGVWHQGCCGPRGGSR